MEGPRRNETKYRTIIPKSGKIKGSLIPRIRPGLRLSYSALGGSRWRPTDLHQEFSIWIFVHSVLLSTLFQYETDVTTKYKLPVKPLEFVRSFRTINGEIIHTMLFRPYLKQFDNSWGCFCIHVRHKKVQSVNLTKISSEFNINLDVFWKSCSFRNLNS